MMMDRFEMLSDVINTFGLDSNEAKALSSEIVKDEYSDKVEKLYFRIIG